MGATHCEVLGVPRDADRQTIARAYRAAMSRLHPDAAQAVAADSVDELANVQEASWASMPHLRGVVATRRKSRVRVH